MRGRPAGERLNRRGEKGAHARRVRRIRRNDRTRLRRRVRTETATAAGDLELVADAVDEPLTGYDLVFVPGGSATRDLRRDEAFVSWLRTAGDAELLASVCTGSLLLGAAGFLDGLSATTHPSAYDLLDEYAEVRSERIVDEGRVVTARGVSSSLDLGLHLVERLADATTRAEIATQMDYDDPYR